MAENATNCRIRTPMYLFGAGIFIKQK